MIRFENVGDDVVNLASGIQEELFPELINVKIKYKNSFLLFFIFLLYI